MSTPFHDTVNQIIEYGIAQGILQLHSSSPRINGCHLEIAGKPVLNFGSCSYLGLEFHPDLIQGAHAAIDSCGTQFAASRAYLSTSLYAELQDLLERLFEASIVIAPTTTLAHIAAIPVLVQDNAAILMDQQVHNSVQTAVQLVRARGVHTELLRHNRMDLLEERLKVLRQKHRQVWYLADGIYSMFGDRCPAETIYSLLEQYPELHFYVDDAHGMSIFGKNGRGSILQDRVVHPRMVVATSLNKAFASGGGVLAFGNPAWARLVGNIGGPLLSSGPMQPGALGAAVAAAKLHLTGFIYERQQLLQEQVRFTRELLESYGLPLVSSSDAAIFFIAVSRPRAGHHIVRKMLEEGFFVNLGIYPTVPMKQTGIRFTITTLHSQSDIRQMVRALTSAFWSTLAEEGMQLADIYRAFKIPVPVTSAPPPLPPNGLFALSHHRSIRELDRREWDGLFAGKGSFDWKGLDLLERSFCQHSNTADNWEFDYLLVRDSAGKLVVAGFFTTALWKDDMLAPSAVSEQVERERAATPGFLTSRVTCCGSLLTEGPHLYIDFSAPDWQAAVELLIQRLYQLQTERQSDHLVLRDFSEIHPSLDALLAGLGFFRTRMPDAYSIDSLDWENAEAFYQRFSPKRRSFLRKNVLSQSRHFKVEVIRSSDWEEEIEHWYRLYLNVKERNLGLNSFTLPRQLFRNLALSEDWEKLQLTLDTPGASPCCVVFCYKSLQTYVPLIIGLDYQGNQEYGIYRQALYQLVLRAHSAGMQRIRLGFTAGIEKQKLGATASRAYAYVHSNDGYNFQSLELFHRRKPTGTNSVSS